MNQAMAQLLANQLGIANENGTLQPSDIAAALANRTSDPLMATLLSQMVNQKSTVEPEDVDDINYEKYEHEIVRLKKLIVRLKHDLAAANLMARYIADVFGACPVCWGLNRLCQHCQGKGRPGYAEPNLEELRAWVEPALHRGGLSIAPFPDS